MIQTILLHQYIEDGYGDNAHFHKIVAVTIDRDVMTLWAKNVEGTINSFNALGCKVVEEPDLFRDRDTLLAKPIQTGLKDIREQIRRRVAK